jgi:hypothetical protein
MKIAIVNSVAGISSKELAEFLRDPGFQVDVFKPWKCRKYDYTDYDVVFNYGFGGELRAKKIINKVNAVCTCVYKPATFDVMQAAGVDTVEYCLNPADIPKKWAWVVVRDAVDGRKAEGLNYFENKPGNVPNGKLFSEYFEHKKEYRVVVFMGKLVGVYHKEEDDKGTWHFMIQNPRGFEKMADHCIRAAKAIGIDYVGFDVVAQTKTNFKILEANSAPILTAESMEAIWAFFNKR